MQRQLFRLRSVGVRPRRRREPRVYGRGDRSLCLVEVLGGSRSGGSRSRVRAAGRLRRAVGHGRLHNHSSLEVHSMGMGQESRWVMVSMAIECLPASDSSMIPLTARHSSNSIFCRYLQTPIDDSSRHDPPDPDPPSAIRVRRIGPSSHRGPATSSPEIRTLGLSWTLAGNLQRLMVQFRTRRIRGRHAARSGPSFSHDQPTMTHHEP